LKIGSFIIGGLAGAAIAMLIQRNPQMSAVASSIGGNVKRRMNGWKDDAIEKGLNMRFASSFRKSPQASSSTSVDGADAIEKLISQDPEVGKEVDAILGENGHRRN